MIAGIPPWWAFALIGAVFTVDFFDEDERVFIAGIAFLCALLTGLAS